MVHDKFHRMGDPAARHWTFLTNHGHVLVCLARSPGLRLRDVAERVGVTERAVQRIVTDLEDAGFLTRRKLGRTNQYEIDVDLPMRHPMEADQTVGAFLHVLEDAGHARAARTPRPRGVARRGAKGGTSVRAAVRSARRTR